MSESKEEEELDKTEKKDENNQNEEAIDWKSQCTQGNLMPGILLLDENKLNPNVVVNPENGNRLLHYATYYGFYNVIRALVEIYHADINIQNYLGYSPLFYIVSNTDANIFNFQYMVKLKDINFNLEDLNGLNILVHSIITNFHYAFLFFSHLGLIESHKHDKYSNPLIYFAIVNNNKFALTYLLLNKNFNINDRYYNNTSALSDILITNKNTSITKFLVKYFNEKIELSTIHTCKKNILNFPFYNVYNYELLNTLYFYKTKNYCKFLLAILKTYSPKFSVISNQRLLEDNLVNNDIGYKYKMINLKYMIYDLILPSVSKNIKLLLFLLYICIFYFGTKRKIISYNIINGIESINIFSLVYKFLSIFTLYIWYMSMFNSNERKLNNGTEIESDIVNTIKNGNVVNLPYIDEICPSCRIKKKLNYSHCYRCKGCFNNKFFHSNLFQVCITKYNIKRYLIYLLLKINFYFICLFNCLDNNKTNKSILAFIWMFRFKTDLYNLILEFITGFFIFKEIGHLFALILSQTVETPYYFIYKYHKKIYPNTLKEKNQNNMIVQVPEINNNIPFNKAIKNLIKNLF